MQIIDRGSIRSMRIYGVAALMLLSLPALAQDRPASLVLGVLLATGARAEVQVVTSTLTRPSNTLSVGQDVTWSAVEIDWCAIDGAIQAAKATPGRRSTSRHSMGR